MEGFDRRQRCLSSGRLLLLTTAISVTVVGGVIPPLLFLNEPGVVKVVAQPIHHTPNDSPNVHLLPQLTAYAQEGFQRGQMELVGEDLDDAVHNVRLGQRVAAGRELLQHRWEDDLPVDLRRHVPVVELRQPDQVGPHQEAELVALPLPPLAHLLLGLAAVRGRGRRDAGRAGHVLDPHPQLVHLGKVLEEEGDGIGHRARCLRLAGGNVGEDGTAARRLLPLLLRLSVLGIVARRAFLGFFLLLHICCCCSYSSRPALHHVPYLLQRGRTSGELVAGAPQQVVPQEQPADRALDALDGPDEIVQDGFGVGVGAGATGFAAPEEDGSGQDLQI